jgi:hypothetical protein
MHTMPHACHAGGAPAVSHLILAVPTRIRCAPPCRWPPAASHPIRAVCQHPYKCGACAPPLQVATRCREELGSHCDAYFRASAYLKFDRDRACSVPVALFWQYIKERSHNLQMVRHPHS